MNIKGYLQKKKLHAVCFASLAVLLIAAQVNVVYAGMGGGSPITAPISSPISAPGPTITPPISYPNPTTTPTASPSATPTPVPSYPSPSMVYPVDGQTIDLEGAYMFKVNPVPNATGYLFGLFQDGNMVYENYRDDHILSSNGEFALWESHPFHAKFHQGPMQVIIRAKVNNTWSEAREINVYLKSRRPVYLPDLAISQTIVSYGQTEANGSTPFVLQVTVKNSGNVWANASVLSISGIGNNWRMGINDLNPGASQTIQISNEFTGSNQSLVVTADADRNIIESNKSNNTVTVQLVRPVIKRTISGRATLTLNRWYQIPLVRFPVEIIDTQNHVSNVATDYNGNYRINLPEGTYTIRPLNISILSFNPSGQMIHLYGGDFSNISFSGYLKFFR